MLVIRSMFDAGYMSMCCFMLVAQANQDMSMTPLGLFGFSTVVAIIAGLASLYRSPVEITVRDLISHVLNMGTCGAALSMLLYHYLGSDGGKEWLIIGICGMISLGGMPMINFLTEQVKKRVEKFDGDKDED